VIPRVRFAPSPTGYLHVGGARTALFNLLFARRHGGVFILRIEDTDVERSSAGMVTGILEGMRWLGLTWDEGPDIGGPHAPYFQSERLGVYRSAAQRLMDTGHAYFCYCSADRLREERARAEQRGEAWQYDRACLQLNGEQIQRLDSQHASRVVRFKVPPGVIAIDDVVHGRIEFDGANIEDFVILRSDHHPTYHLSVVVDDLDMGITHVIRGDDHISNTPKHVLLFGAFGAPLPRFAHVPLILGADRKRLSKRHGATSVTEYQRQGYLPEALVNFLALLGWAPGDDRELMNMTELVDSFELEGISSGDAVFNTEKLDWMNGQYISQLAVDDLAARVLPFLEDAQLAHSDLVSHTASFHRMIELLRPRAKRLTDFVDQARPLLRDTVEFDPEAIEKNLSIQNIAAHLDALAGALGHIEEFDETYIEAAVRGTASKLGIKAGPLIHATRLAVTGRTASPGLFEVLALLGRDRVLARLGQLRDRLASHS
jgi:glutamyl-tRNA synthetase